MTVANGTIKRKLYDVFLEIGEDKWKGIIPETLCQFTGLIDNYGNRIFEGDLLELPHNDFCREGIHEVSYYKDGFVSSSVLFNDIETANKNNLTWVINRGAKVIGNKHD